MIIAVDFDDTLHDRSNIRPGYKMGIPMPGAVEAIWQLKNEGHEVFILTASTTARKRAIADWLQYFKFPVLRVTDTKYKADVYLDDKAIRFINWEQALNEIS